MTLRELQVGESAEIRAVGGEGALRQHFLDMGVIPGAEVTVVKLAPMGDPMELQVHGYELTLRLADAEKIENQFQIDTAASGAEASYKNIADCESFSVSFDNGVEEWTPFDTEGWTRRLMTAKSVTISVTAKRNIGDPGNDTVAGLAFVNGRDAEKSFQWTFPDGTVISFPGAVISVTALYSGDSTNVAPLEFEVMSNGKPQITAATLSE